MLKNLLLLGIFTLFTVSALIIFNLYHSSTTTKIADITSKRIVPISPKFDTETLNRLKSREFINVDLSESIPVSRSASITPQSNIASPSPQIRPTISSSSAENLP